VFHNDKVIEEGAVALWIASEQPLRVMVQHGWEPIGVPMLVTRAEEGMTLYREGNVQHERAKAREVSDVTGAGDTVIATLAAMLACGADLPDAMHVANHAAGIVVGKLGTAVVHPDELAADLAGASAGS